jgi:hypothetical protein
VIFNDENINKDFNAMIYENLQNILGSMTIEDKKRDSQMTKVKEAIQRQEELMEKGRDKFLSI